MYVTKLGTSQDALLVSDTAGTLCTQTANQNNQSHTAKQTHGQ